MTTIRELLKEGSKRLALNGVEEADVDARLLLLHVLNINSAVFYMIMNNEAEETVIYRYYELIDKRCTHYPLQYITGSTEFMGLSFKVDENVLIPRFDTEILVEEVLKLDLDKKKILDMCTGSGCIAISLKKLLKGNADVTGVDISEGALKIAEYNAKMNDTEVSFIKSDLFENINERYDVIVSNPPYIRTSVINELMEEVKSHEPFMALDGKEDGLFFYGSIIKSAPFFMNEDAVMAFEIGYDQADSVKDIMKEDFYDIKVIRDFAGLDRVVMGRIKSIR
ncbi:MAG: peptide chain release factor N(5)-glutamine methyltransferase [Lachnospiraceae bacterium]|nr:peptide chain release factor N(5)-glutamine methyltransferase [Lachnospiraceae bacterium]